MTLNEGFTGLGLLPVVEGVLPFAAPGVGRDSFRRMTEMNDGQIRFIVAALGVLACISRLRRGQFEMQSAKRVMPQCRSLQAARDEGMCSN